MTTLFEQQGGQYEMQGDYALPCVTLQTEKEVHIGAWGERHRRYLKANHRVRYYNLLTAGKLNNYLADIPFKILRTGPEGEIFNAWDLMKNHFSESEDNEELKNFLSDISVFTRRYSSVTGINNRFGDYAV